MYSKKKKSKYCSWVKLVPPSYLLSPKLNCSRSYGRNVKIVGGSKTAGCINSCFMNKMDIIIYLPLRPLELTAFLRSRIYLIHKCLQRLGKTTVIT